MAPLLAFGSTQRKANMDRSQLLKRLEKAWEALEASYAGLSDLEMMEPGVTDTWSVRDIIAHVTWWEEEALMHLPLILEGGKPPRYSVTYGGIDAFNALMTEQKRNLSLSEVLRQRDDTHRRLIDFIQNVPEDQFVRETRFRRRLRLDTYNHYLKHSEWIRSWRAQRPAGYER
ncbi:MAG: DinB family protein [Deltaproteobacteria bacterium]|nr:DinB family protein [Deltaproteobacteria bacterium]